VVYFLYEELISFRIPYASLPEGGDTGFVFREIAWYNTSHEDSTCALTEAGPGRRHHRG